MIKETRYNFIEKYLRGTLTGLEQREFEDQLKSDTELRKELELHRGLHQAIGDKKLQYFSELVKESESKYFDGKPKAKSTFLMRYGRRIAGIAAILAIGTLSYFILITKPSTEELFAMHFDPHSASIVFRSDELDLPEDNFILALARFDEGQYGDAAQYFSETLENNPDKDIAVFLRGVSYLAIDSLTLAEADLRAVLADDESLFQDQASWYLGLLYLKMEDEKRATQILKQLKQTDDVKKLLKEIGGR